MNWTNNLRRNFATNVFILCTVSPDYKPPYIKKRNRLRVILILPSCGSRMVRFCCAKMTNRMSSSLAPLTTLICYGSAVMFEYHFMVNNYSSYPREVFIFSAKLKDKQMHIFKFYFTYNVSCEFYFIYNESFFTYLRLLFIFIFYNHINFNYFIICLHTKITLVLIDLIYNFYFSKLVIFYHVCTIKLDLGLYNFIHEYTVKFFLDNNKSINSCFSVCNINFNGTNILLLLIFCDIIIILNFIDCFVCILCSGIFFYGIFIPSGFSLFWFYRFYNLNENCGSLFIFFVLDLP